MKQMPCIIRLQEPDSDEILPKKAKKKKSKGQREADLKDFPEDVIPTHTVSKEVLDAFYGEGNWKQKPVKPINV